MEADPASRKVYQTAARMPQNVSAAPTQKVPRPKTEHFLSRIDEGFICKVKLLCSLCSLNFLDQIGNNLEQVTHDAVISDAEDGGGLVLVHGNDGL